MRGNQIILLAFAIIAIGLFVLPNTMSMFMGQHSWYSVKTAAEQYDMCERCHLAEVGEWKSNIARGGAHAAYTNYYGDNTGCFCHQINESQLTGWINTSSIDDYGYEFFNATGTVNGSIPSSYNNSWRSTNTPHAATTIFCVDCHLNASQQLNNTGEAHMAFYRTTLNASGIGISANTACLACHTMVGLNITMERNDGGFVIYANHTNYTSEGYGWTIDISVNESRTSDSTYWPPNETHHG